MNTKSVRTRALRFVALAAVAALSPITLVNAAAGYTYTLVHDFTLNMNAPGVRQFLCDYAINDVGQVAYVSLRELITNGFNTGQELSVHVWDASGTDRIIYSGSFDGSPTVYTPATGVPQGCGYLGTGGFHSVAINDVGVVSFLASVPTSLGGAIDTAILDLDGLTSTPQAPVIVASARLLSQNRGYAGIGLSEVSTRAILGIFPAGEGNLVTFTTDPLLVYNSTQPFLWTWGNSVGIGTANGLSVPAVNKHGHVAAVMVDNYHVFSQPQQPVLLDTGGSLVGAIPTATYFADTTWNVDGRLGMNARGEVAVSGLIGPAGAGPNSFKAVRLDANRTLPAPVIADTSTFPHSLPTGAISLTDAGEVFFATQDYMPGVSNGYGLWSVGADGTPINAWSSADASLLVFEPATGQTSNRPGGIWLQAGALPPDGDAAESDRGQIAFTTELQTPGASGAVLLVATPAPGLSASAPLMPTSQDPLTNRMTFEAACSALFSSSGFLSPSTLTAGPFRGFCYIDPPVASGYTFEAVSGADNFQTVILPAPLAGGQSAFIVNYTLGASPPVSAPLTAGQTYTFPTGGVSTFTITGINASEALSATDPNAFVVGLTWVNKGALPTSLTMLPLVDSGPTISHTITGAAGANGWYVGAVTVSWTVTNPSGAVTSQTGCDTTTVSADTAGQTLTCTATTAGGTNTQSVTIKLDQSVPTVTGTLSPLPNVNGWNSTAVVAHFTGADPTSGISSCTTDQTLSADAAGQTVAGTCTNNAGLTSAAVTLSGINIDKTAPTVSGSRAPAPNAAGWNNSPVVVSFSAVDPLSGVNPSDCSTPVTLATDGSGQAATGNCLDKAGNSGSATVSGISIDRTPPVATALATPAPNGAGWNNSNVTVSFTGTDSLSGSGVAGCSTATVISVEAAGQAVSGNCTDVAGNVSAAASRTVRIDKTGPTASITTPANGASFVQGTQVLASYQCTDALSGIAQCSGNVPTGLPIDTASAGSKTFTVSATDAAGNVSLPATVSYTVISTNTTDTTPPVIVPTVAGTVGANGWYRSNVSLTWSVTDPESQIRSTVGCGPATLASDTTGKTYACKATSTGGTAAVSITLKRDTSSPLVTIRVPTSESHDATYRLGQAVRASYSCADSPSGVASCAGSVPSGALLDTSSRGTKTLSVTATDNAGNIRTVNQSYRVN